MAVIYNTALGRGGVSASVTTPGAAGQIAYWESATAIAGEAALAYDAATDTVTVGGGLVVNEGANNADFRVEGQSQTHLIFADASADKAGINTSAPLVPWHVNVGAGSNPAMGSTALLIQSNAGVGDSAVLTLLSGTSANTNINFATASSLTAAQIRFANNTNLMALAIGGGAVLTLDSGAQAGINIGYISPAGRIEAAQSGGDTDLILRQTNENASNGCSVEFATGSAGSALAATNQIARIYADITQATPSALKGELVFSVNAGDSVIEALKLGTAETRFNDSGADIDFVIEGDADTQLFKCDAGQDNIGIGSGSPDAWVKMRIEGALALSVNSLSLSNGANENIEIGIYGTHYITGPTAAFSVAGFQHGSTGRLLIVFNATSQDMTITHESLSSTAANRINTCTGSDVGMTAQSSAMFFWDPNTSRWILISHES